jgi:uncharacterized protein
VTKIYWDSNLFIYLFEENPRFVERVRELRSRMLERGDLLFTGTLTVGEVLVKPVEKRDIRMIAAYRDFFNNSSAIHLVALDVRAAEHYAAIRADRGISHADAIQLACAAAAGIDLFITNDERLHGKIIPGIKFVTSLSGAPL